MVQRNGGYIVAAIVATIGWQFLYTFAPLCICKWARALSSTDGVTRPEEMGVRVMPLLA